MTRFIIPTLIVLVLSLSFSFSSMAEVVPGQVVVKIVSIHTDKDGLVIVEDNVTPLEIGGGSVVFSVQLECPGGFQTTHDSLVVLNQEDPNNLQVYKINQINPDIVEQSTIPVNQSAYGSSRNMYTRSDGEIFGSFINGGDQNGGELTSIWSENGLDYDADPVNPGFNTYGSSTTAPHSLQDGADPCTGGPNLANNRWEVFCSQDDGASWNLMGSVDDVTSALEGGTVGTFGPTGFNSFWVFAAGLTNVEYTLRITDTLTGESKAFDTDMPGNTLADSCGVSTPEGNGVVYRNRMEGKIKVVTFPSNFGQPGGPDPVVHVLGDDPNFDAPGQQGFYGFGCTATPGNPNGTDMGITAPGGKRWDIDFDTGKIIKSIVPPPNNITQSGPTSMNSMCTDLGDSNDNPIFGEGPESGDTLAFSQSLDYAQFIYVLDQGTTIPTLSEWGLIALAGILMLSGAFYLRRKVSA